MDFNMQTILPIAVAADCIILLILAAARKCTKKTFFVIALITALCCGAFAFVTKDEEAQTRSETEIKGHIYMASQLLEQFCPDEALVALGQISEAEGENYGVNGLRALAYNHCGAYSAGAYLTNDAAEEELLALHSACVKKERCDEEIAGRIILNSMELLALSGQEMARYDAEIELRYGMVTMADDSSDPVLQIKAALFNEEYDKAYQLTEALAAEGTLADDILMAEMYVKDFGKRTLAEGDRAFDELLTKATDLQIRLNRIAAENGVDSQEYENCRADYALALIELDAESSKRAINYLELCYSEGTVYELAYHLQMARLYFGAGDRTEAAKQLYAVFAEKNLDKNQWLAVEVEVLRDAFLNGTDNMENPEFDNLYEKLLACLYREVFKYQDTDTQFRAFLSEYLKDIFSGIYIGRPDVTEFPTVKVSISTSFDYELTPENMILTDTQCEISEFSAVENDDALMSICFVLDRSGSMMGSYLASAKQAIKGFATNIDGSTLAALVSFDHEARVDCPIVDSAYMVAAQVDKIEATGGTSIAAGLMCAADELANAKGRKVIILLSDGVDGSPELLNRALSQLQMEGIVVYSIGLPGCDENYLFKIAEDTEGTYFPANSVADLSSIYTEIRGSLRNSFTLTYEANDDGQTERSIWVEAVDSMAQSRRKYTSDVSKAQYSYINDVQISDFFKQIGGTLGGE